MSSCRCPAGMRLRAQFAAAGLLACLSIPSSLAAQEADLHAVQPAAGAAAPASEYLLGPQDRLTIRIGQWRGAESAYEAWADVSGEYIVGPEGGLSLPLAGPLKAAGKEMAALAEDIAAALRQRLGLTDPPEVTVGILEYRPVYVVGTVRDPGAFPYVPGLTVVQALGLAGGIERAEDVFLGSERNALSALGDYEVLRLALWRNLAREARIEAELAEAEEIEIPQELADAPVAEALLEVEREIMSANERALESNLAQITGLEDLLRKQIEKLDEQILLRERQVQLAEKELEGVDSLMNKGLTVASRQSELARTVADLESGLLDRQTAKLRAEQQLNEAQRDRLDLVNDRRRRLVEALSDARAEIAELHAKISTAKGLFAEAAKRGTELYRPGSAGEVTYTVIRRRDSGVDTFAAERATPLLPGDVLEVSPPELETEPLSGELRTSSYPLGYGPNE